MRGELPQRVGREAAAGDSDRIDRGAGEVCRGHSLGERRPARDVLAVCEHDDHVSRLALLGEVARGHRHGIPERSPGLRVRRRAAERCIGIGARAREACQREGLLAELDHLDAVGRSLRPNEGARCGRRVSQRSAGHRLRVVDAENDALRASEVEGLEPGDRQSVLVHVRRGPPARRDDGHPQLWVAAGVDADDAHRARRRRPERVPERPRASGGMRSQGLLDPPSSAAAVRGDRECGTNVGVFDSEEARRERRRCSSRAFRGSAASIRSPATSREAGETRRHPARRVIARRRCPAA